MTQFDQLALCLLAAGGAPDPEAGGTCLLHIDPETSSLESKLWFGEEKFGSIESIAESVRPDSTAACIITPSIRLVACISSNNKLHISEFDFDRDEWVKDATVKHEVHPDGHVTGIQVPDDRVCIVFQDPSERFNLITKADGSWRSTTLPAMPTAGSPIATWMMGDQLHIFYVSADDNSLHYLVEGGGKGWTDVTLKSCQFDEKTKPKRILVMATPTSETSFQVFVMTESKALWMFRQESEKLEKLGNMKGNKFQPDTTEELSLNLFKYKRGADGSSKLEICVVQ